MRYNFGNEEKKMSKDESVNAKMYEMDSASLCTLCVLETSVNVFQNFSSSLSLDNETSSSFNKSGINLATLQQSQLNFVEKNVKAGNDCLQSDWSKFDNTEKNMMVNNDEVFDWTKSQPEKNNDPKSKAIDHPDEHNVTAGSKSCGSFLKCSQKTFENKQLLDKLSSQKDEQDRTRQAREQSAVFSFSSMSQTLSMEIGVLPKISQTIIDQVINDMDNDLMQSQKYISELYKFDKPFDEQQQVSILKTSRQTISNITNTENIISTVNSSLEPIKNFQLRITNDENRLKKVQFYNARDVRNIPSKEMLKRDKNKDATEEDTVIPKKKPKIITQEVLKFPLEYISLRSKHPAIEESKENIKNDACPVNTKDFQGVMKKLWIQKDTTKCDRHIVNLNNEGGDKCKKNDEENGICSSVDRSTEKVRKVEEEKNVKGDFAKANTTKIEKSLQDRSQLPPPLLKKPFPKKVSSLSILQRRIDENSKRLINQVKEMKQLSSFIDELRENFVSKETGVTEVSRAKREKEKEFVSRGTQTTDPHPVIIDVEDSTSKIPSVVTVQEPNAKSSEIKNNSRPKVEAETAMFLHNWFHPVTLKNNQDTVRELVTSERQMMPKILPPAPEKVDHQLSVNKTLPKTMESQQKPNSSIQYDPYYNPLRPRRWPRNRNNQSTSRPRNQSKKTESYFPPLPIVIRNVKVRNVTQ